MSALMSSQYQLQSTELPILRVELTVLCLRILMLYQVISLYFLQMVSC